MRLSYKVLLVFALCILSTLASAADYPSKPVKLIVPSSPGGTTDISARVLANKLPELLGQQVVVENRPGAGSRIGNEYVAKSPADGYTLLMGISALAIIPSIYKEVRYDALKDFAPISQAIYVPNVLSVHPSVPAKSVKELIAIGKRTTRLLGGSAGTGSNPHLSLELFKTLAKIDITHVPFKGSGRGVVSLMSGEVDLFFLSVPTAMPHIRNGRIRPLGVTTSSRSKALPRIPTIAEAGVPGYEVTQWFGVLAPSGTPSNIISLLYRDISGALNAVEVKQQLEGEGAVVVASSPKEFSTYMHSETEKWSQVIRDVGIEKR